jgi:hypothetical protein
LLFKVVIVPEFIIPLTPVAESEIVPVFVIVVIDPVV